MRQRVLELHTIKDVFNHEEIITRHLAEADNWDKFEYRTAYFERYFKQQTKKLNKLSLTRIKI